MQNILIQSSSSPTVKRLKTVTDFVNLFQLFNLSIDLSIEIGEVRSEEGEGGKEKFFDFWHRPSPTYENERDSRPPNTWFRFFYLHSNQGIRAGNDESVAVTPGQLVFSRCLRPCRTYKKLLIYYFRLITYVKNFFIKKLNAFEFVLAHETIVMCDRLEDVSRIDI